MQSIMAEVLLTLHGAIPHGCLSFFRRLHLRCIVLMMPCLKRWKEVDRVADHVKSIQKSYDPLEDGGRIIRVQFGSDSKTDRKAEFTQDEKKFHPERSSKDRMLSVMYPKALILPANEYSANYVAYYKYAQEGIMEAFMVSYVEDAQKDEASRANNRSYN